MTPKMHHALLFLILAVVAEYHFCQGAPRPSNTEVLEKSIADYLRHDKELINELKQLGFEDSHSQGRVKRQSEIEIDTNNPDFIGEEESKPGFFDKAAKFVVELLQRFLKWINQENR